MAVKRKQVNALSDSNRPMSRREFVKYAACAGLAASGAGTLLSACAGATDRSEQALTQQPSVQARSHFLPSESGLWSLPSYHADAPPAGDGQLGIEDIGRFTFDAGEVTTVRPDIFQPGHFSLFDILVHLSMRGDIALDHHYDDGLDTHIVDGINGESGWWYYAYYSNGWYESNVFRMDMYPYKNNTTIGVERTQEDFLESVYSTLRDEVGRLARNDGQLIIPSVSIRTPSRRWMLENVEVNAHDVRSDVLRPGVMTALDALLSLGEQGEFSTIKLTWYEQIRGANPVDSYWVNQIDDAVSFNGCGLVYETGPKDFSGFKGSHIHIPSDVRVTVSPEYALWFWICL